MKALNIILIATLAQIAWIQPSSAMLMPGQARPVAASMMSVENSEGTYDGVKLAYLEVFKKVSKAQMSSVKLVLDGRPMDFEVTEGTVQGCRAEVTATKVLEASDTNIVQMKFVDNAAGSQCPVVEKAWEVEVTDLDSEGQVHGRLLVNGNPEPIFTIQVQQSL